jgi:pyruvate kinase
MTTENRNEAGMKRLRNVKIVATLGPASSDHATIRALYEAGADVFRLNMSHGSHDEIRARHAIIREIERETGRPIAILADLQGPKIRCGAFARGAEELEDGQAFRLDLDPAEGDATRVSLPHPEIFAALEPGARLLVNDGKIRLKVDACGPDFADCTVVAGGTISNRKGVNVPDVVLPLAALSDKDRTDLEFVCQLGVDWLALSFVQRAEDVEEARALAAGRAAILSKIEKPAAVKAYDSILAVSDGIMVARGDLGVELPVQNVPPIQKRLIRGARAAAKPVIVATQMLESMIESPMPTRAEVSDVATAIYEGADAVMLSAESAAGAYPVEAVTTMNNVAVEVESDPTYRDVIDASRKVNRVSVADGIVSAAREIAETAGARAICCFTHSGTTARLVGRERPHVPILALTPLVGTARRLCLNWGTFCVLTDELERFKMAVVNAARAARIHGFATETDQIVVTAGIPFNVVGSTNILRVAPCDERLIYKGEPE